MLRATCWQEIKRHNIHLDRQTHPWFKELRAFVHACNLLSSPLEEERARIWRAGPDLEVLVPTEKLLATRERYVGRQAFPFRFKP